jgi:hypothetical protein
MSNDLPITDTPHPAPQRRKTQQSILWLSVVGPPIAWAAHLLVNYTIAGQRCGNPPAAGSTALADGSVTTMLLIDVVALLLAGAAGYVAYGHWLETKSEKGGSTHELVHSGEGRTRFLAMCGMLTSALVGVGVAIDVVGTIIGPPC